MKKMGLGFVQIRTERDRNTARGSGRWLTFCSISGTLSTFLFTSRFLHGEREVSTTKARGAKTMPATYADFSKHQDPLPARDVIINPPPIEMTTRCSRLFGTAAQFPSKLSIATTMKRPNNIHDQHTSNGKDFKFRILRRTGQHPISRNVHFAHSLVEEFLQIHGCNTASVPAERTMELQEQPNRSPA